MVSEILNTLVERSPRSMPNTLYIDVVQECTAVSIEHGNVSGHANTKELIISRSWSSCFWSWNK